MALFYGDQGAPGGVAAAPAAPKIQIEKPPVYGAVKGLPGLLSSSPWTQAQRAAGMRREVPLGVGTGVQLGTNRVAPPPMPMMQPRQQLADMLARRWAEGGGMWGGGGGSRNRGGYTTSTNQAQGGWGRAPGGTRSSATRGSAAGWGGGLY